MGGWTLWQNWSPISRGWSGPGRSWMLNKWASSAECSGSTSERTKYRKCTSFNMWAKSWRTASRTSSPTPGKSTNTSANLLKDINWNSTTTGIQGLAAVSLISLIALLAISRINPTTLGASKTKMIINSEGREIRILINTINTHRTTKTPTSSTIILKIIRIIIESRVNSITTLKEIRMNIMTIRTSSIRIISTTIKTTIISTTPKMPKLGMTMKSPKIIKIRIFMTMMDRVGAINKTWITI